MTGDLNEVIGREESSLREGFFSRRSNLTTIATSVRIKIIHFFSCFKGVHELTFVRLSSFLAMTTLLKRSVIGSLSQDLSSMTN
ncbi:hypothetical protein SRABI36_02495 [Pedobacter sp. Bi36]|nr:hypothetical protein [Flavobacterium sp. W4I14]CAH0136747.1 hypothetical protein SRABI126_00186 [Pedobacter sp. Bi126]CAH0221602.1 hypothetical protein SRABI36_02495 [Pedobacter sp. Bi36]